MLLYSHTISPRLRYITDFIGKEFFGEAFELTSDKNAFLQFPGPSINYSKEQIKEGAYWLQPHSLLFEKGIHAQDIACFETKDSKAFFKTGGDFPFDILAASFYLISRYEEYLPHVKDGYGRYAHENSLAFRNNFLHIPLINVWLKKFKEFLEVKFPQSPTANPPAGRAGSKFQFLPTYDIDEAYSYKHKGWWRTTGATVKAILTGQWIAIAERRKVLTGKMPDPFDAYDWMDKLHREHKLEPRYFFLLPEKTGKYDRNILPREIALQELIRRHAAQYEIGIHPSWQSGDKPGLLKKELSTLEKIAGKKITASRQHFIRMNLPQTYRLLYEAGIPEDFSMGYGSINGFRASVASPFYWYDLGKEEITGLLLYPFCFMDANSFFEQKLTAPQAFDEMQHYYKQVKLVNGIFISIWHNTFLGTGKLFAGWREMYERFIKENL